MCCWLCNTAGMVDILLAGSGVACDHMVSTDAAAEDFLTRNVTGTVPPLLMYLFVYHFIVEAQEYFTFTHNMRVIIPHSRNSEVLAPPVWISAEDIQQHKHVC